VSTAPTGRVATPPASKIEVTIRVTRRIRESGFARLGEPIVIGLPKRTVRNYYLTILVIGQNSEVVGYIAKVLGKGLENSTKWKHL